MLLEVNFRRSEVVLVVLSVVLSSVTADEPTLMTEVVTVALSLKSVLSLTSTKKLLSRYD